MPRDSLIAFRRGTAAAWTSANPTLAAGECGFETDTLKFKIGDGSTAWVSLAYQGTTGSGGHVIEDEGTPLTQRADLNFTGAGVTAADAGGKTVVTIPGGGASGTPLDGWVDDTAETWTYATGSGGGVATFTVSTDLTAKYTVGTRIKLTQTSVKYFVVTGATYSSPNTTVTIMAGSSYTLANAAISANYHSYAVNPQGYPGWFNWTSGAAGFSSLSTNDARFAVNGRVCHIAIHFIGTSNATTFTFNLPIAASSQELFNYWLVLSNDNSVTAVRRLAFSSTTAGRFDAALNANNGWTASGLKSAVIDLTYEI